MKLVNGVMGGSLPAADRGLAYGDGVFRTLRVRAGEPQWWADQYAKLAADARALDLVCPREDVLRDDVRRLADGRDGVAKLILTRGCGERGYQPPAHPAPTRIASFQAGAGDAGAVDDVVVRWCSLRLGRQPRLAGIKHLNRLENVLARAEWNDPAIDEGLLCDDTGAVVSGVSGNLFMVHGDVLLTPDLGQCGVAGVARERILRAAKARGASVEVTRVSPQMVLDADAVVLCNSIRGVRRVARLENRSWAPGAWPGRLSTWLHEVD
jgi:4-amino-4-deoxychorismate lyase